jgi:hypothetical protein
LINVYAKSRRDWYIYFQYAEYQLFMPILALIVIKR